MCKILVDELKVYPQMMKTIIKKIKKSNIADSQKIRVCSKKKGTSKNSIKDKKYDQV